MKLLGTTADVSGYAMNTTDGELALRLRSPAFSGPKGNPVWLISDGNGMWNEAQPHEASALEEQWESIEEDKGTKVNKFANRYFY